MLSYVLSVMVTSPPAFMNCPARWTAIKCIPALQPLPVMKNNSVQASIEQDLYYVLKPGTPG